MHIDDPCLASSPIQARNYIIACYPVDLIQGENIKGLQLRHAMLMGYIRCTLQLHRDRHLPNPQGAPVNYISLMTNAVRKWELVPNCREVIHDAMFRHILQTSSSHHEDSLQAVATDWSLLGRYTGFRNSEWCQDSPRTYARISDPLWGDRPDSVALIAKDFMLKDAHGIRVTVSSSFT